MTLCEFHRLGKIAVFCTHRMFRANEKIDGLIIDNHAVFRHGRACAGHVRLTRGWGPAERDRMRTGGAIGRRGWPGRDSMGTVAGFDILRLLMTSWTGAIR